jgi:hypothetical protein
MWKKSGKGSPHPNLPPKGEGTKIQARVVILRIKYFSL